MKTLTKIISNKNNQIFLSFVLLCLAVTALPCEVQAKVSDMGANIDSEVPLWFGTVKNVVAFVGFCLFIGGIIALATRKQTNVPTGVCAGMIVFGALAMGSYPVANHLIESLLGTTDSGLTDIAGS